MMEEPTKRELEILKLKLEVACLQLDHKGKEQMLRNNEQELKQEKNLNKLEAKSLAEIKDRWYV